MVVKGALGHNPRILIVKPQILFKLLRNFGHLIRNLGVDFSELSVKICAGIQMYLVEYCSNSLERFAFETRNNRVFDQLHKPLEKLISLAMQAEVNVGTFSFQFINEINLPNLQDFMLESYAIDTPDSIQHKNVEHLTIGHSYKCNFPFLFENLKYLTLQGMIEITDALCEFIDKMVNLKVIKIMTNPSRLHPDSFNRLLNLQIVLTNVEEVEFSFDIDHSKKQLIETVFRFMSHSPNVKKVSFRLYFEQLEDAWFREFSPTLNADWISYIIQRNPDLFESRCVIFERRPN